jgi:hypothetical protein
MRKDTVLLLIFVFVFSYYIIVYYEEEKDQEKDQEKFNSVLDIPTGFYTDKVLCQSSPLGPVCSSKNTDGYCTDNNKICFGGSCTTPVCGGSSISVDGSIYSQNSTGYCSGNYSCNNGSCESPVFCGTNSGFSRSGVCFDGVSTCKNGVCDPNIRYCGQGGTGCSVSGYNCINGRCIDYVKSSNFSFGGYNSTNLQTGLTDTENKVFQNVDIGTIQNANLSDCKTACNNNVNCGAFTRSAALSDDNRGDCYLKKRFNDSKGNMLSNRYGIPSYAYNSWIKVGEREKLNIKRSIDGKIFSLK